MDGRREVFAVIMGDWCLHPNRKVNAKSGSNFLRSPRLKAGRAGGEAVNLEGTTVVGPWFESPPYGHFVLGHDPRLP